MLLVLREHSVPEASVTPLIELDLNAQQLTTENIKELHIDRAYLVSDLVKNRTPNMTIICKAANVCNSGTSVIYEVRYDDEGEYIWLITYWKSTRREREIYEQYLY